MEWVNWPDVVAFLEALSVADPGKEYRLPTEAEWEYAARAGTRSEFGGTGDPGDVGWTFANSGARTHPVAQKMANDWGLFDMHGNVDEWVQDFYSGSYYSESPADDPQGPDSGLSRVVRGGSWWWTEWSARCSARAHGWPNGRGSNRGFRLVREQ